MELLTVVGIMGVLSTLALLSVPGLFNAAQVKNAAYQISETLDQARTYAMAQNTYVWVRFDSAAPTGIQLQIQASRDQSLNDVSANMVALGKTLQFQRLALNGNLPSYGGRPAASAKISASTETPTAIQFNPEGEAFLAQGNGSTETDTLNKCIEVGLQSLHGQLQDTAALQIGGLTGQSVIYRP